MLPDTISDEEWLNFFVQKVQGLSPEERQAQFVTAVALAVPANGNARVWTADCTAEFVIELPPRGTYPPGMPINAVRYIPAFDRRYPELSPDQQMQVHRGKLREPLYQILQEALSEGRLARYERSKK